MNDLKSHLRDSTVLVALMLVGVFGGLLGAVSWHYHLEPNPPRVNNQTPQPVVDAEVERHAREVRDHRTHALVPIAVAVPLTFTGLLLACVCGCVLAGRHMT